MRPAHSCLRANEKIGSYAFVGCKPKRNATIVDRLIRRGMIIIGKANLTEFCGLKNPSMPPGWSAVGGQCQSPYVSRHIAKRKLHWELSAPGGSSTGSAVAVASGFSTLAVGTDTIGSLITPANRAALYALKPTVGQVPMDGIFNLSKTFDAVGGMVCHNEHFCSTDLTLSYRQSQRRIL
jgi:amidase